MEATPMRPAFDPMAVAPLLSPPLPPLPVCVDVADLVFDEPGVEARDGTVVPVALAMQVDAAPDGKVPEPAELTVALPAKSQESVLDLECWYQMEKT
jgi:hypothetical protein